MNITMLHDLDTGFFAATMKPAFQALGHKVIVLQTVKTYLDPEAKHVDHLLSEMKEDTPKRLLELFKDTDLFILRTVTDNTLRLIGILPYLNTKNMIYRVHGSELRERGVPYTLRTWRINWYRKEPVVVGPRDPSLIPLYHNNTITHIERPCDFSIFPRKRQELPPFALHTPTRPERKGTYELLDHFTTKSGTIQLRVESGAPRSHILVLKSKASYFIDYLGDYNQGPYGMNTVEAWYYLLPVFSTHKPLDMVLCPELQDFVIDCTIDTMPTAIKNYEPNKKTLNTARQYALTTHSPTRIAQQYLSLAKHIQQ